jgi:hypothetical protein
MDRFKQGTQAPFDDEERELMDADSWDWDDIIEGEAIENPGAVVTIRFSRDEYLALGRLAGEAGVGTIEFIKQTMLQVAADRKQRPRAVRRPA